MSAEPVAKVVRNEVDNGFILQWEPLFDWGQLQGGERLYASSPAQARALAIQEAARVCEEWGNAKVAKWSGTELETNAKSRAWDGLQYAAAIRALSSPPSVTQEWVRERVEETFGKNNAFRAEDAVLATLAALGIAVEGAAK
tara:strand:+ start:727 stop:1152 length:426 start_codon:yes stop_codon:yes gene_type:complete